MALIPGTLPNDTCYGTPQDLLELFAQYLDVPAFALNSKVVFSNANPVSLTADVIWFDTGYVAPASATNPILKITVSGGFVDYIKNYITNAPVVTIVGADTVLILDATDGNTKRGLVSDIAALAVPAPGSVTPAQLSQPFTSGTAVATSGTAIDFTGIPSWVKRITVMLQAVSANSSSNLQVQIGSGSIDITSTYVGHASIVTNSVNQLIFTTGFLLTQQTASVQAYSGAMTCSRLNSSTNLWVETSSLGGAGGVNFGGGNKSLAGALDRVRITTVDGITTFTGGSVNIMYE